MLKGKCSGVDKYREKSTPSKKKDELVDFFTVVALLDGSRSGCELFQITLAA